jgi:hypothetical protein
MSKYMMAWLPMALLAIANGVIRDIGYGRQLRELRAHQISTLTAIILLGLYIWALLQVWPLASSSQAATVGLTWLLLTVVFEFTFGYFVAKHPLKRLLHDYNLLAGRVWVLVLIWVTVAPYLFYQVAK